MQISSVDTTRTCPELDIINEHLSLDGASIIELGCGAADITRLIAKGGSDRRVLALEVDEIQHAANLEITDLDNVVFGLAGAQAIPAADNSADVIFMFKSLHHVPLELIPQAFAEIARVLKPGGLAYISEPVLAGEFNEILRLFHDEQAVREAAFAATCAAVASGQLELVEQLFFNTPLHFTDFEDFEHKVIGVSHTQHSLSEQVHQQVQERFANSMGDTGSFAGAAAGAAFTVPVRVDLLRKPGQP